MRAQDCLHSPDWLSQGEELKPLYVFVKALVVLHDPLQLREICHIRPASLSKCKCSLTG